MSNESPWQHDDYAKLLEPVTPTSVHDAVYQALCRRLMHGVYQAGQVLGIQELADDLHTSTMPVREALRRLVAQKALEPTRSRSVRVPLITADRLLDLRRVRLLVEGQAIEWATPRLALADVEVLHQLAADIQTARIDLTASLELNRQFHFLIYQAAASKVMLGVIESLWLQSGPYLRAVREHCGLEREAVDDHHDAVVAALKKADAREARQALEADISWPFDQLSTLPK